MGFLRRAANKIADKAEDVVFGKSEREQHQLQQEITEALKKAAPKPKDKQ